MVRFSFSKKLRLLTPNHFAFVFQKPHLASTSKIAVLSRKNSLDYPRIGLVVSKRAIKSSHERNRLKRLIRESFRLHQYDLPAEDFVVIAKQQVTNLNNHIILKDLKKIWNHYSLSVRKS